MVTSVFVNNIPKQVHWRWLWRIFSNHGEVVDVFIPYKRSKSGKRFGFVRFSNHLDALKVISRLNGVWLLNSKIGVNIARFKGRTNYWRKVSKSPTADPTPKCDTFVPPPGSDLSPGNSNAVVDGEPGKMPYLQALLNNHPPSTVSPPQKSLKKDAIPIPAKNSKSCSASIDVEDLHSLECCLLGVARDFYETNTLLENFRMNGVSEISLKKISGKQFLIKFNDKEFMSAMEEQHWCWLKEWFVELSPWTEDFSLKHRVTWVSCFGVPVHCWNYETFKNIANLWGELISLDEKALNSSDLSKGSLRIMTNQLEKIEEIITISCGSKCFPVRVSEIGDEWISLFHCCCNSRSIPQPKFQNFQSNSSSSDDEQNLEVEQSPSVVKDTSGSTPKDFEPLNCSCLNLDSEEAVLVSAELANIVSAADSVPLLPVKALCSPYKPFGPQSSPPSPHSITPQPNSMDVPSPSPPFVPQPLLLGPISSDSAPVAFDNTQALSKPNYFESDSLSVSSDALSDGGLDNFKILKQKRKPRKGCTLNEIFEESDRRRKCKKKKLVKGKKHSTFMLSSKHSVVANASLSDGDFKRRKKALLLENAVATWNIGKLVGLSATCDDNIVIEELLRRDQLC